MTRPDKTFIIRLPVWVTPKRLCQKKKKKWRTEHLEGLRVPSTLQLGQLLRGGDGSRFGTNLLRGVIGPISTGNDYLNTVFDYLVSLRGSCRNKRTSHGSHGKSISDRSTSRYSEVRHAFAGKGFYALFSAFEVLLWLVMTFKTRSGTQFRECS